MLTLFLKIFFSGLCLILVLWCIKRTSSFVVPLWSRKKRAGQLNHFIADNQFDRQTIEQILKFNLPPRCQLLPPNIQASNKQDRRIRIMDLTQAVNRFINEKVPCRHLLILADSGRGKTCFSLNYYLYNKTLPPKKQSRIILIPMRLQNADQLINNISDQNNTVLFLDGLDEDGKAFHSPHQRLRQLIDQTNTFKRVIITSHHHFIPKIPHLPTRKGYEIIEPKSRKDNHIYRLKRFYISPMTYPEAGKFLHTLLPFWERRLKYKILEFAKMHPSVGITPLVLTYLQEIILKAPNISSKTGLYKAMIQHRIAQEQNWKDKNALHNFLCRLSKELYLRWVVNQEPESITIEKLTEKAGSWGIPLHPLKNGSTSLLRRSPSGTLRFSHRSILEYLFLQQVMSGDKSCCQVPLTGLMKTFLFEYLMKNLSLNLNHEFQWLSSFELKAQGLKRKTGSTNARKDMENPESIFQILLKKNNQYGFLNKINILFKNPIFYEFGWDPQLYENLKKAVLESKSSLMKLDSKNWTVLINQKKIDITKHDQKNTEILINKKEYQEYISLKNNLSLIRLNQRIGLKGLGILNNINQSKTIAVLPDLNTFDKFTVCFENELLQ